MDLHQQQLYKILSHFHGMNKLDAFDLLHKIEVLLYYTKSPLKRKDLKEIIESGVDPNLDIDSFQFTILANGNFCEYIDSNSWLQIYKETKRGIYRISPFKRYYFKSKYAPLELLRLNNDNLLDMVKDTSHEQIVMEFLNNHRVNDINKETGEFLLLKQELNH